MTDPDPATLALIRPDEFPRFAVQVYNCAGVSAACLLLQDTCEVDVNLVLLAAYLGAHHGVTMSAQDAATANDRVRRWQQEVIQPLRAVRRRLSDSPRPAPDHATAQLRTRLKELELEAETIELAELGDFAANFRAPKASGSAIRHARASIQAVLDSSGTAITRRGVSTAVVAIAQAAARISAFEAARQIHP